MINKLMIAAAGAGKTTAIVKLALDRQSKSLITTFTKENEQEIKNKIMELNHGAIPEKITVQTWFSFLLEHGVRPFQGKMIKKKINGLILVNQKSGIKQKRVKFSTYYKEEETEHHYFNRNMDIYSDKLTKFALRCDELSGGMVLDRITKLYETVFIDEVQDLAGHDLTFIQKLLATNMEIIMVGDPRQVTYHTHFPSVNKKYSDGKIEQFIKDKCTNKNVEVDYSTLKNSRRNCQFICNYANQLFPDLPEVESDQVEQIDHLGVYLIPKDNVNQYLEKYEPLQLRASIRATTNSNYKAMNFGASKGKTIDRVLIYPTQPIKDWIINHNSNLKFKSRCQFYVALTRAKYSAGIVWDGNDIDEIPTYNFEGGSI